MTYYCLVMHYIWFRLVISWLELVDDIYKYFSDLNVSPIYITRCMRCDT